MASKKGMDQLLWHKLMSYASRWSCRRSFMLRYVNIEARSACQVTCLAWQQWSCTKLSTTWLPTSWLGHWLPWSHSLCSEILSSTRNTTCIEGSGTADAFDVCIPLETHHSNNVAKNIKSRGPGRKALQILATVSLQGLLLVSNDHCIKILQMCFIVTFGG